MNSLLLQCDKNYNSLPCCHPEPYQCNCSDCMRKDFHERPDIYNCEKKANYYVLNYGPSFTSEIYHYFTASQILENNFNQKTVNILSLGCGFAPDLLALERYIFNNNLSINFHYHGLEISPAWITTRSSHTNTTFLIEDVSNNINFTDFDIIFIVKLFSTLRKNNLHNQFLISLNNAISSQLVSNSYVIFIDINSIHMGRDDFHDSVKGLFGSYHQYYSGYQPPYYESSWTKIEQQDIVFSIPDSLCITPLREIRNNIFFEYRK
jgi:hypothetical protein